MSRLTAAAVTCLAASSLILVSGTTASGAVEPRLSAVDAPASGSLPRVAPPTSSPEPELAALAVGGPGGLLNPIESTRIIDTRLDGEGLPVGAGADEIVWYDISTLGLPADTVAVVLNVTATQGTAPTSFVTALDGGALDEVPTTSSLNSTQGRDVANLVTLPLVDGYVGLYNDAGSTHLIADIQGFYRQSAGAGYEPVVPSRALDTRASAPVGANDFRHLRLTGVPADATAVAVTVTSTQATSATSYVGAWPFDAVEPTRLPDSSVLNAYRGSDIPNLAIVPIGDQDSITLYNDQGSTHLVVDVVGWFVEGAGAAYHPVVAHRAAQSGRMGPASEIAFTAGESALSVPAEATAVALNLTTASPSEPTYLTVYPSGAPRPLASSANARVGADVAAGALTRLGPGFTVYNDAGSVLTLVDVQGYFAERP